MRRDDRVQIKGQTPPMLGKVADVYKVPTRNIQDDRLAKQYPDGVPMVEVILDNGKLHAFVENVVERI
jgi:hypothetical protein